MSNELEMYSSMQTGVPYKTYKKTILGKVYVSAIDPFSEQITGYLLYGDPKRGDESCFIDMWSERDDLFFRKSNRVHFEKGYLMETVRKHEEPVETPIEQASDETLKGIINMKFLALQSKLNKIKTEAVLLRILDLAREMDKSEAIIRAIEARLTEVQELDIIKQ
jgi:hypothetical protein